MTEHEKLGMEALARLDAAASRLQDFEETFCSCVEAFHTLCREH